MATLTQHKKPKKIKRQGLRPAHKQKDRHTIQKRTATYEAGYLFMRGLSNKAITARTGLTAGQIRYLAHAAGIPTARADARNGAGFVEDLIDKTIRSEAMREFTTQLQEHLGLV